MVENKVLETLEDAKEGEFVEKGVDIKDLSEDKPIMNEEDYGKFLERNRHISTFKNVGKVRSVKRAINKGRMTPSGVLMPSRPYNNKKNTCKRKGKSSREANDYKRKIYADVRRRYSQS